MLILGLDCSSITIGWALIHGRRVEKFGHHDLTGDIGARCALASYFVANLLEAHEPALVVIESPVARFAKAVIPQARVSGAVLAVLADASTLWHEATPAEGKQALTGRGNADKTQMVRFAAAEIGHGGVDIRTVRGKVCAVAANGTPILTEDEADAIGLALAGLSVRVEEVAA